MENNDNRDDYYRWKLQTLRSRLREEIPQANARFVYLNPYSPPSSTPAPNFVDDKVKDLQEKYNDLKVKMKFQKMEQKMHQSFPPAVHVPENAKSDRFDKYMEMVMVQQSQMQNMLMNQIMIKNFLPPQSEMPPPVPNAAPKYPEPAVHNPPAKAIEKPVEKVWQPEIPKEIEKQMLFENRDTKERPTKKELPIPKEEQVKSEELIKTEGPIEQSGSVKISYPGTESQIRLRKLGLAAFFCSILDTDFDEAETVLHDRLLFEIKIEEIIVSIQKYYLNGSSSIRQILLSLLVPEARDFKLLLGKDKIDDRVGMENELNTIIQGIATKLAEIMPPKGTLGYENRSLLSEFVQSNQMFPEKYFFQVEKELLQLDANSVLRNVGLIQVQALLVGAFVVRTLVMTVLRKPIEYGLAKEMSDVGRSNLRILATLFVILYRMLLADYISQSNPNNKGKKVEKTAAITELNDQIMTDEEIEPILRIAKKSIDAAKVVISKWASTYSSKLRPP